MILVDTSVWVDHLRTGLPELADALEAEEVLAHPFVIGELACGNLRARREVLENLQRLQSAPSATASEVLTFIEENALMGSGIGYIDAHLLAATALADGATLWTRDARLRAVSRKLGLAYR